MAGTPKPFWETKRLDEMTDAEWESLCDGCGRCCLMKLEDDDSGDIVFTDVGCTLFDGETCRCKSYDNRAEHVPDCVKLTPEEVRDLTWLPPTCAYKLVQRGQGLKWWHPLVSGTKETVIEAGISVKGRVSTYEHELRDLSELEEHVVEWPIRVPRKRAKK